MKKEGQLFFILFLFFLTPIIAQPSVNNDSSVIANRIYAHESICLLKNKANLIPIKNLNQKIACISIGCDTINTFQKRLSDYTKITNYNLRTTESESNFSDIKKKLKEYNLIIASFHNLNNSLRKAYGITAQMDEMFQYLTDSLPSAIVIFGSANALYQFSASKRANLLLVSSSDSIDNQDFAAQIIFGGLPAIGKLKIDVQDFFTNGNGVKTKGELRFCYKIPEELGVNPVYLNTKIDSIAELGIRSGAFPGCQVFAAKNGAVFFHKTYGFHTYDSIVPVSKSDLYDFASLTKITGPLPALMKLYDEGNFKLDTKFTVYWPDFKHSNKKNITVRDVLTHQAQLQAWLPLWKKTLNKKGKFKRHTFKNDSSKNYPVKVTEQLYLQKKYRKKIYKAIKKSKLNPEKKYKYSDLPFLLFPAIIEKLTSSNYEYYLKENFYKTMGAYTLTYNPLKHFNKSVIIPTEKDTFFRMEQIHGMVHDESAAMLGGVSGNAGLFGTTIDLAKLMQMYLNKGQYGGIQLISDTTIDEFTRCQFPENENRRGLGFDKPLLKNKENGSTAIDASEKSFGHSGFTGTFAWADPETGILFVFMSNRVYPTRNNSRIYQLNIRPAIHQVLYDVAGRKLEIRN